MRTAIENEEQWHAERAKCAAGSSDGPTFYGCGYDTPFGLFHKKKGNLPASDTADAERMENGLYLEPAIAALGGKRFNLALVKNTGHYTDDAIGGLLGATPDYWLEHEGSDTVVEIKAMSWGAAKDFVILHEDGETECPLRFQIQIQGQLACTGARRGILLALISGDRLVKWEVERHEAVIEDLRGRVIAFNQALIENIEPPVDMPVDMAAANKVWAAGAGTADMRGDARVEAWLTQVRDLRVMEKQVSAEMDRVRGQVQTFCHETGLAGIEAHGGRISYKQIAAKPAKVVERPAQPARNELRITVA